MSLRFQEEGAQYYRDALNTPDLALLQSLSDGLPGGRPGTRLSGNEHLRQLLAEGGSLDGIAKSVLGGMACPVRAILFDKSAEANWALGWHQDRTIAVRERVDVPGFETWSKKAGIIHVEPPFEFIERMVTLRAHLDACDENNAPLMIAPGSHRLGRVPVDEIESVPERLGYETCLADAGDVWLYATAIIHASEAARVPRHRRVLQVDFSSDELPGGLAWLGL